MNQQIRAIINDLAQAAADSGRVSYSEARKKEVRQQLVHAALDSGEVYLRCSDAGMKDEDISPILEALEAYCSQ